MAKARIGHFVEAQILQALGVDFVDESEVLTPPTRRTTSTSTLFDVPFVCGATNLGEALRRISEGAAMIRSKGEAGTGNVVEAVRHLRSIIGDIKRITQADSAELFDWAKQLQAPAAAGAGDRRDRQACRCRCSAPAGLATPADAALAMQLGAEAVFVGSGIFKSDDPGAACEGDRRGDDALQRRRSILAKVSRGLGAPDDRHRHGRDRAAQCSGGDAVVAAGDGPPIGVLARRARSGRTGTAGSARCR